MKSADAMAGMGQAVNGKAQGPNGVPYGYAGLAFGGDPTATHVGMPGDRIAMNTTPGAPGATPTHTRITQHGQPGPKTGISAPPQRSGPLQGVGGEKAGGGKMTTVQPLQSGAQGAKTGVQSSAQPQPGVGGPKAGV